MKTRIELDPQVADFVRSQAPERRRRLREGLRGLEEEKGDLKQLEADLTGYARLRAGSYRVIIRFYADRGERVARCVYAECRVAGFPERGDERFVVGDGGLVRMAVVRDARAARAPARQ